MPGQGSGQKSSAHLRLPNREAWGQQTSPSHASRSRVLGRLKPELSVAVPWSLRTYKGQTLFWASGGTARSVFGGNQWYQPQDFRLF